jgi:hypothetical protein
VHDLTGKNRPGKPIRASKKVAGVTSNGREIKWGEIERAKKKPKQNDPSLLPVFEIAGGNM